MKIFSKMTTSLLLLLLIGIAACTTTEENPGPEAPDASGVYTLTTAELVEPDTLVLLNVPVSDGMGGVIILDTMKIPAGPETIEIITALVGGALAAVPCADPANYGSFRLELTADKKLIFHCDAEDVHNESGTWSVLLDTNGEFTILNLSVNLEGISVPIPIAISGMVLSDTQLMGTANNYPMKKDLAKELSETGNQQFLTTIMVFARTK